jgi:signal transduction histidine kinase
LVIELHRGDISVESREGVGSQFTVRLPSQSPWRSTAAQKASGDKNASNPAG